MPFPWCEAQHVQLDEISLGFAFQHHPDSESSCSSALGHVSSSVSPGCTQNPSKELGTKQGSQLPSPTL